MIFYKKKRTMLFWRQLIIGNGRKFYMHTYLTSTLFMRFNITRTFIVCESNGIKKRSVCVVIPFLLNFVKTVDFIAYSLCLYTKMCLLHFYY